MQPSDTIELPQFTKLSTFALHLTQACTSWRAPRSGEDFFTYFAHRATGDELGLRATLIREHILPVFNYTLAQIEFESQERFDLTLWGQHQQERRRIAIIETKSSATQNLALTTRGRETPVEQLERTPLSPPMLNKLVLSLTRRRQIVSYHVHTAREDR